MKNNLNQMRWLSLLLLLGTIFTPLAAQPPNHFCGTDLIRERMKQKDTINVLRERYTDLTLYRYLKNSNLLPEEPGSPFSSPTLGTNTKLIPVVFHVVHKSADATPTTGTSNIPDAQLHAQLDALNYWFQPMDIQFCLALKDPSGNLMATPGITRRADNYYTDAYPAIRDSGLMAIDYFPSDRYLNIWVVDQIFDPGGGSGAILGAAYMPGAAASLDGIIMLDEATGDNVITSSSFSLHADAESGKVLVHELGHWLGLYHTFEEECNGDLTNPIEQWKIGDRCQGTPPSKMYFGCAPVNTCNETYFGSDYPDLLNNFMAYSGEPCRNTFEASQGLRMSATLDTLRTRIWSDRNLVEVGIGCAFRAYVFSSAPIICLGDSVWFTANEGANLSYYWEISGASGIIHTQTTSTNKLPFLFSAADMDGYTVNLTITDLTTSNSTSILKDDIVKVSNCTPLPSNNANWFFGHYAGMKFTTDGPIPTDIAYQKNTNYTIKSNISYSDSTGSLLFYGGGYDNFTGPESNSYFKIFDKDHNEMPGSPVYGNGKAKQQGIVIPFAGNKKRFYLFTTTGEGDVDNNTQRLGFHYNIIDLDSGTAGKVTRKNIPVRPPEYDGYTPADSSAKISDMISAAPHCNGRDYWIVVHSSKFDNSGYQSCLWTYLVTDSSVTFVDSTYTNQNANSGNIKFSPDGTKIAFNSTAYEPFIADFNKSTGEITNLQLLAPSGEYGLAFSPNSKVLYVNWDIYRPSYVFPFCSLFQYDLTANNIPASQQLIYGDSIMYASASMQLGPDGRIYFSSHYDHVRENYRKLGVIKYPNNMISSASPNACGFEMGGVEYKFPNNAVLADMGGLPNAVDAIADSKLPKEFSYIFRGCDTVEFSIPFCAVADWDFGDTINNTATGNKVAHRFSSVNDFNVSCIVNGDTITQTISLGVPSFNITGPEVVCDSNTRFTYSVVPIPGNYDYHWTIDDVPVAALQSIRVEKRFTDFYTKIKLVITDRASGCQRSDSIMVNLNGSNNAISGGQVFGTNTYDPTPIMADTPSTGLYYQWEISYDNITWAILPDDTLVYYDPPVTDTTVHYRRRVTHLFGCTSYSQPVTIYKNTIYKSSANCLQDSVFHVFGSRPKLMEPVNFPSWEYSTDGITFFPVYSPGILYGMLDWDFLGAFSYDSVYLRRSVTVPGGSGYSNVVKRLYERLELTRDLRDTFYCATSGSTITLTIALSDAFSTKSWYVKRAGSTVWQRVAGGNSMTYTPSSGSDNDSVVCYFTPVCSPGPVKQTRIIAVKKHTGSVTFLYQPNNTYADENQSAFFEVIPDLDIVTHPEYWGVQWQVSRDGGSNFFDLPGETHYQLFLTASHCEKDNQYRAVVTNGCNTNVTAPATLIVDDIADLYIRDSYTDDGTEPVSGIIGTWTSPDIWNRRTNDTIRKHEAPQFTTFAENYTSTLDNYMYAVVHNRGTSPSRPSEMTFYWSRLSSGQKWETSWADTPGNRIFSAFFGREIPLGDKVNEAPILIPTINPGDSFIVEYRWQPPNGFWYGDFIVFNSNPGGIYTYKGSIEHKLCYLARITPCDFDPYGMKVKETKSTVENVKKNNNIAARNEAYRKVVQPDDGAYPCCTSAGGGPRTVWTLVQNPRNGDTIINIKVETDAGFGYSSYGKVYLIMDDAFYSLFTAAGSSISGAAGTAHAQIYEMTSNTVSISGLSFHDTTKANLGIDFIPDTIMPTSANYRFTVTQWSVSEEEFDGGATIELDPDLPPPILGKRYLGIEEVSISKTEFFAFPNPNTGTLYLSVKLPEQGIFTAKVMNNVGQEIMSMERPVLYEGAYSYQLDLNGLAAGIYYVEMRSGDAVKVEKIILQK